MKFSRDIALKNVKNKPFRSVTMAVLVAFLSFTVFGGALVVMSLQNGLKSYQARLGADIVVVPSSSVGHDSVDEILLQGMTGNYYMNKKDIDKVLATEGIEAASLQFFLTSAKASCCSARVQIIGFDPATDFSVRPWITESYSGTVGDDDLVVGSNINVPENRMITFYGNEYRVAAQLEETGTGLDSAVYTNMNTIKKMAESAARLLETSPFKGVNIGTAASAVMIRVAEGYEISDVTDDINIHITKVEATQARNMVSQISSGLGSVSGIIGALIAVVWVLAIVILIAAFAMVSNERKKEFAVLRTMGASRKMLFGIMSREAAVISLAGALLGLALAALTVFPLSGTIKSALELPFLMPGVGTVLLLCAGTLLLAAGAGVLTSVFSARQMTKSETGLLLREDA